MNITTKGSSNIKIDLRNRETHLRILIYLNGFPFSVIKKIATVMMDASMLGKARMYI